jgi:predicted GIY-YIG superfamily endonuclease
MRDTWRTTDIYLEPHVVYRIYDKAGDLLYVGVTVDFETRMQYHRSRSAWFPGYSHHELTEYPDRWKAESAETAAIMNEQPRHNQAQAKPLRRPRPEKPFRFTLDLDHDDHQFLREFVASAGAGGSAAQVMRALLAELRADPGLADRIRSRLWQASGG